MDSNTATALLIVLGVTAIAWAVLLACWLYRRRNPAAVMEAKPAPTGALRHYRWQVLNGLLTAPIVVVVGQVMGSDIRFMAAFAVALALSTASVGLGVWWVFGDRMRAAGWEW